MGLAILIAHNMWYREVHYRWDIEGVILFDAVTLGALSRAAVALRAGSHHPQTRWPIVAGITSCLAVLFVGWTMVPPFVVLQAMGEADRNAGVVVVGPLSRDGATTSDLVLLGSDEADVVPYSIDGGTLELYGECRNLSAALVQGCREGVTLPIGHIAATPLAVIMADSVSSAIVLPDGPRQTSEREMFIFIRGVESPLVRQALTGVKDPPPTITLPGHNWIRGEYNRQEVLGPLRAVALTVAGVALTAQFLVLGNRCTGSFEKLGATVRCCISALFGGGAGLAMTLPLPQGPGGNSILPYTAALVGFVVIGAIISGLAPAGQSVRSGRDVGKRMVRPVVDR